MARTSKPWWRKDRGTWCVTIDGKRHNLGPDKELAFQRFHHLMAEPKSRQVSSDSVAAVIDAFLDWTKRHRAIRTYEWYMERCQGFVDTIPNLTIAQLKPFHVQLWLDAHPHWSDGHKRGCIIAVQRPLRWALKMGYIERNPIAYIEKPEAGKRELIITPEDFEAILAHVKDAEFRDLLTTAWEAGPRPQEILRAEARHVDLDHSRWVFPKQEAKGKRRIRIVYLTETALETTKRRMLKWQDGPIFRNSKGRPWTPYAVNCRFQRLQKALGRQNMKELGIERSEHADPKIRAKENDRRAKAHGTKYCLYAFRHSFATRMLENGLDALTVSILLGHSDTSVLGKVYQHLSHNPQHLLEQVRKAAC